ncbi:hypothetical protein [Streptomyces sp. NBC_01304]|uniref:hypothetical protein n=1 Tax=Streptomyces sp. NBC_01304 TaxID=2903818 RepID=UPI002E0EECB2|nr:hypothetical protein OG430_41190 [Streptomyces sp. NBC_01304]
MPITGLWPTSVHIAQLNAAGLSRIAANPELLPDLLPTEHPGHRLGFKSHIERWEGGFHAGLRHGSGTWCTLLVLESHPEGASHHSGAVIVHDPRSGAANVGLPGLPWGRPLTLPTRVGLLAVLPGWLAWQVAPVRADEHRTVLIADSS